MFQRRRLFATHYAADSNVDNQNKSFCVSSILMLNHFLAVMQQHLFLLVTLFPILSIYLIYSSNLTAAYNKSFQCIALSLVLGSKLSFPSDTAYILSSQSYFAQQENELYPLCIITSTTSKDVSLAIWSLSVLHALSGCRFAIPGGGHNPFCRKCQHQ